LLVVAERGFGVTAPEEGREKVAWLAESERDPLAADCERWRMESSEGLWRRSWLLDARWPGV
jgi:hypothetical protein